MVALGKEPPAPIDSLTAPHPHLMAAIPKNAILLTLSQMAFLYCLISIRIFFLKMSWGA